MSKRVFLIVLDSVGVGELPDAAEFGDEGSNTVKAAASSGLLNMPNMKKLGFFNILGIDDMYDDIPEAPMYAVSRLAERSKGKDTTTGHWEIAGLVSEKPMPTFPNGFPADFIEAYEKRIGRKVLCNKPYSGTDVIRDYDNEKQTVTMKEASFPLISMEVEGMEMNLMHGYAANLDSKVIRDCIIPVTGERSFTVNIDERGSNVKKLKYQIFNIDGRQKEEDSFTILEDGEGKKNQKISLKETYETGSEYILKLTLITNTSKRIYYYSRIKMYDQGRLKDKIDFILNFHKVLLDPNGRRAEALMDWLEPSRATDISTFAHVGIKSRLNMVSYGSLNPKVVYEQVPTVTEFYENYASVRIDYILSVDTETGTEYYRAEEDYRIGLKGDRTYLYNYERSMEELFDIKQFSMGSQRPKGGA